MAPGYGKLYDRPLAHLADRIYLPLSQNQQTLPPAKSEPVRAIIPYSQPLADIVSKRFSCRSYQKRVIDPALLERIEHCCANPGPAPLAGSVRFKLVAAGGQDHDDLKGLGTYGWIRQPAGFLIGAAKNGDYSLENLGYLLEKIILLATDLGLGSCWLGGTFSRSSFAKKITLSDSESLPVVAAIGYPARSIFSRRQPITTRRKPAEDLFFAEQFGQALPARHLQSYQYPLEMVRLAPSAANKQPWRIVRTAGAWHFYLHRTPGYKNGLLARLMEFEDLQRIDMGIAMSHFAMAAGELAWRGEWRRSEPDIGRLDQGCEYIVSWIEP